MLIVQLAAQEKRSTTTGVETHPEEEEEEVSEKIFKNPKKYLLS